MEQYWMPKELEFENLKYCLDNYSTTNIFIRDCGGFREDGKFSCQGQIKINELLEGRRLDFRKDNSGLDFFIDTKFLWHFPLESCFKSKGFSVEYERFSEDGRRINLSHGINPYDISLPDPKESILRNIFDNHMLEISFDGRIDIKFHSWWKKPYWKYWNVKKY